MLSETAIYVSNEDSALHGLNTEKKKFFSDPIERLETTLCICSVPINFISTTIESLAAFHVETIFLSLSLPIFKKPGFSMIK